MITKCPYCAGTTKALLSAPDVNRRVSDTIFHLRHCQDCGLDFLTDPPADLGPYYTSDYHYIPKDRAELAQHLPMQRFKIDMLERFCPAENFWRLGLQSANFAH